MAGAARVGDNSQTEHDAHGCPGCPHPAVGPAIIGSPDVFINSKPAIRQIADVSGTHAACCGPNMWWTDAGSTTVLINGKKAVRKGDATQHCGGAGKMIEGSPDVIVGG